MILFSDKSEYNHLCKTCSVGSFRLHVCEVFVELPELLHGRSEGHYLTAGIQGTLHLYHLHDGFRRLCRENVTINNKLLKLCLISDLHQHTM